MRLVVFFFFDHAFFLFSVPTRLYNLCFVEFDNKYQATIAMHALQGYRMDKNDSKGLTISYAKSDRKERRRTDKQAPYDGI